MRPDYLIEANSCEVLPMLRELFSRRPETFFEAWEWQSLLFLLCYSDGLVPEAEIVAAMEVARGDYDPEGAAA
jgi:hypothetical protein